MAEQWMSPKDIQRKWNYSRLDVAIRAIESSGVDVRGTKWKDCEVDSGAFAEWKETQQLNGYLTTESTTDLSGYPSDIWWTPERLAEEYGYSALRVVYRAIRDSGATVVGEKWANCRVNLPEFEAWILGSPFRGATFKSTSTKIYDDYWVLNGDWCVTSDWHVPYYDADFSNMMLELCLALGIKQHLVAGDFFDQHDFSPFMDSERGRWEYEKEIAEEVGHVLFTHFDTVKFLVGNHDLRCFKVLNGKGDIYGIWEEVFLRSNIREIVSLYSWCVIESGGDNQLPWVVAHPSNASRIPGTVPRKLLEVYPTHNILTCHGHKTAWSQDASATRQCVEITGMIDQRRVGYTSRKVNMHPKWEPSFAIIKKGYVHIFTRDFTDWDFWLSRLV